MPADRRTALVTGANRGLGLETCRQLGDRGYRVFLAARGSPDGEAAAAELARSGLRVEFRPLDVDDEASARALADRLAAEGVMLDVLVNNAGISLDGFDERVARETMRTNFLGPMRVTDALIPRLRDGANIVMVSSGAGELMLAQRFSHILALRGQEGIRHAATDDQHIHLGDQVAE